jgi:hypothetical protein
VFCEPIREAQCLPLVGHVAKPDASPVNKGDTHTLSEYLPYWLDAHAALCCSPKTFEEYRGLAKYLLPNTPPETILGTVPTDILVVRAAGFESLRSRPNIWELDPSGIRCMEKFNRVKDEAGLAGRLLCL